MYLQTARQLTPVRQRHSAQPSTVFKQESLRWSTGKSRLGAQRRSSATSTAEFCSDLRILAAHVLLASSKWSKRDKTKFASDRAQAKAGRWRHLYEKSRASAAITDPDCKEAPGSAYHCDPLKFKVTNALQD